jgi:putative oxidoreductase
VKSLNRLQPVSLLVLRIALGVIFLFHGYPKLAHPSPQIYEAFADHGFPRYFVQVAGIVETFGGGLLLLGLFTRGAALLLAIEMCVAIWKVHFRSYLAVNEFEFPMALAVSCFLLATLGAGRVSLDGILLERGGGKPKAGRGKE